MYYSDMFGEELTEDDERLVRTLMKVGTLRDERIFVKDETEQKQHHGITGPAGSKDPVQTAVTQMWVDGV